MVNRLAEWGHAKFKLVVIMNKYVGLLFGLVLVLGLACDSSDDPIITGNDLIEQDVIGEDDVLLEDGLVAVDEGYYLDQYAGDTATQDSTTVNDVATGDTVEVPEFPTVLSESLQKLLAEHVAFSPDPGLTLTVRLPEGATWTGAAGYANLETLAEMVPDSAFRVGSNTKPVVAVTVLKLVEQGLIELDAPLTDYLPEYSEWSNISVRQLLNMRSGLKDFLGITLLMIELVADPFTAVTPEHILEYVRDEPLDFEPGTDGKYTNSSYLLLGMIIEEVTGKTADQALYDLVIGPLGMDNTYLDVGNRENDLLTEGYIDFQVAGPALGLAPGTENILPDPLYIDGLLVGTNLIHPTVTWTAGSLVSTSKDMATLVHALMGTDFLLPGTLDEMTETVQAELFSGMIQYGLGLQIRETPYGTIYGHGGLNFGYQAGSYYFPDSGVTLSHMHNFLLESYDPLQNDVMEMVLAGGDPDFEPCLPPEDIYKEFDSGEYLNVAFKGAVNEKGVETVEMGNTTLRLATETGPVPFSGILPSVTRGIGTDGSDNLTIVAYSLSPDEDIDMVMTTLTAKNSLFNGIEGTGGKEISLMNLGDLFLMVIHCTLREGTADVYKRLCVVAISDYRRTGEVALCGSTGALPEAGDTLRLFAAIPFLDDPALVAGVLAQAGASVCSCLNDEGQYEACED